MCALNMRIKQHDYAIRGSELTKKLSNTDEVVHTGIPNRLHGDVMAMADTPVSIRFGSVYADNRHIYLRQTLRYIF